MERCCYVLIHATRKVEDNCRWLPLDPVCPMLRGSQVQVSLALKTTCPSAIACLQLLLLMQDLCFGHPCSTHVKALTYPGNNKRSAPGHGPGLASGTQCGLPLAGFATSTNSINSSSSRHTYAW